MLFLSKFQGQKASIARILRCERKRLCSRMYLRTKYDDEHVEVNLVASKSRVSPIKQQTILRLELLGAKILICLVESISSSTLGKLENFCWVDSVVVLCWIKNNKPWKQFVQRRVEEIRQIIQKRLAILS